MDREGQGRQLMEGDAVGPQRSPTSLLFCLDFYFVQVEVGLFFFWSLQIFFSCSPFMCLLFLLQASDPAQKMGVSLSAPGMSNREMLGKSSETHHMLNITTVPKAYCL